MVDRISQVAIPCAAGNEYLSNLCCGRLMKKTAGYSGTPLWKKLGIKPGARVKTRNAPQNYMKLIAPLPDKANVSNRLRGDVDIWHLFTTSKKELQQVLACAMTEIHQDGMIWISWPKKSSGKTSEVTESTIREVALPMGLVDVKVCAVDETWSGLKVVIRKELRR